MSKLKTVTLGELLEECLKYHEQQAGFMAAELEKHKAKPDGDPNLKRYYRNKARFHRNCCLALRKSIKNIPESFIPEVEDEEDEGE